MHLYKSHVCKNYPKEHLHVKGHSCVKRTPFFRKTSTTHSGEKTKKQTNKQTNLSMHACGKVTPYMYDGKLNTLEKVCCKSKWPPSYGQGPDTRRLVFKFLCTMNFTARLVNKHRISAKFVSPCVSAIKSQFPTVASHYNHTNEHHILKKVIR